MRNVEKICHVKKFLRMRNVETNSPAYLSSPELISYLLQHYKINDMYIFYVLSYIMLFCCKISLNLMRYTLFGREICFVAVYALWRGENWAKKKFVKKKGQISGTPWWSDKNNINVYET